MGVKRPVHDTKHVRVSPFNAEVNYTWIYKSTPPYAFLGHCWISQTQEQPYVLQHLSCFSGHGMFELVSFTRRSTGRKDYPCRCWVVRDEVQNSERVLSTKQYFVSYDFITYRAVALPYLHSDTEQFKLVFVYDFTMTTRNNVDVLVYKMLWAISATLTLYKSACL
jgi:hypothetical protein